MHNGMVDDTSRSTERIEKPNANGPAFIGRADARRHLRPGPMGNKPIVGGSPAWRPTS